MKKLIQIIFCFLISLPAMIAVPVDGVENVHLKDRTRFVTDGAGVMSAQGLRRADLMLADIWEQSSAEPVVVIVDNLDGEAVSYTHLTLPTIA